MRMSLWCLLVFLVLTFSSAQAYDLKNDVIDDGGTKMTSSNYVLRGSFGQPTIGKISSANYVAYIGFWHPYPAVPGVEEDFFFDSRFPLVFALSQNYPNPVVSGTSVKYAVPARSHVSLEVFNSAGQRTRTLVDGVQEPGYYEVKWDLRGVSGDRLPNGVYFYRMLAADFLQTKKMVILR
jgi:hypothetical protein